MRRLGVATTPVFTGPVAVLALNDHILKATWPGLITGKLSDLAGVVVVAIVLSVIVGRTAAVGLTAIGFVALKAVPGVNVLAAPALGGVTRTDPTDLVALVMLVPTFWWLGRALRESGDAEQPPRLWRRWLLGGCALGAAVLATTATSCPPPHGVTALAVEDDRVFAATTDYPELDPRPDPDPRWYVSDDGGRTWTFADDAGPGESATWADHRACGIDACWRVVAGERVEQCPTASRNCTTAFEFTAKQIARMVDEKDCGPTRYDEFSSVLVMSTANGEVVIVSMGTEGVLVRDSEGEWDRRSVGDLHPISVGIVPGSFRRWAFYSPLILMAVGPLLLLQLIRHPKGLAAAGFAMAVVGGVALLMIATVLYFFGTRYDVHSLVITVACIAVFGVSLYLALRRDGKRPTNPPDPDVDPTG